MNRIATGFPEAGVTGFWVDVRPENRNELNFGRNAWSCQ